MAIMRRLRMRRRKDEDVGVDISPLIDCVFLLLIFFLVTTMLKKLEKQIPVTLPDYTSALAQVSDQQAVIYALDDKGNVYRAQGRGRRQEGLQYAGIDSLAEDLKEVAETQGVETPIRIDTDRDVPVQKVIDLLDVLALQGFENVGVRLRHREELFFEVR